ncbi:hypothetical protein MNV49_006237 [Pseudohyphozyma bogoriensis]|nr:hypothetical protein MNV49_006237 [Pseudohyphozyma bogoriensis]
MATAPSTSSGDQLIQLLAPPSLTLAQAHAVALLPPSSTTSAASLGPTLSSLLTSHESTLATLDSELSSSSAAVATLLATTKHQLADILARTEALKGEHEQLEDSLIDHREALVSPLAKREQGDATLREKLVDLGQRRTELEAVKGWFATLAEAERLGIIVLAALQAEDLDDAFDTYVELVEYIQHVHLGAPTLALTSHLVAMASSVWNTLVKALSARVVEKLTAIGWPTPFKERLNYDEAPAAEFREAFVDMLILEQLKLNHPLPDVPTAVPKKKDADQKPMLAFGPVVQALLLRFRWQFDGTRGTNRIDKPEYPLSHVLNLLSAHERFLQEDIQDLLDEHGFSAIDAMTDFTSLLLPPLSSRLRHHTPQLLVLPPVLAHTIYQTLDFDEMLRKRNYRPRGHVGEWNGLSEVILGKKEWFATWLAAEKSFFDDKYYKAIGADKAWEIISEEDFDSAASTTGVRPTNSSLKVAEIVEQLADRYRPLPTLYTLPFLLSLHLPMLASYSSRIASALYAFESVSFGILPGGLADRAATAGVGGVLRLVRAGISARWMEEKCGEWGEDAFFLSLFEFLKEQKASIPAELKSAAETLLATSEGTLFDEQRKTFGQLADKAEELVVKHVARDVLAELKAYLGRRWDFAPPEDEEEPSLTPDLIAPLSLFSALLSTIVASFPPTLATTLYRRISASLSVSLYDRLLVNRTWSESGAKQLNWDIEYGFLQAGREAGIKRGVGRGWELLTGGAKIMALPASSGSSNASGEDAGASFASIMKLAFDDAVPEHQVTAAMEELGVGELVGRKEILQALLRRRPECWR